MTTSPASAAASSADAIVPSASLRLRACPSATPASARASNPPSASGVPRLAGRAIYPTRAKVSSRTPGPATTRLQRMAQPARRVAARPEAPPVDPEAIDRAYHYHRARRNARLRRRREKSQARLRFVLTFAVLAGLALFLMLTIWHEVQKVFGL